MGVDDDPLLPPCWLPELKDGLGDPLIRNIWQQQPPKPIPTAPQCENLTAKWTPEYAPIFVVPPIALRMVGRLNPLLQIAQLGAALLSRSIAKGSLIVQLHDEDPGVGTLRMDAPHDQAKPQDGVFPDAYCLGSHGFLQLRKQLARNPLPPWRARQRIACWRGASTDSKGLRVDTLSSSKRYQLCLFGRQHPELVNARFINVVQCANPSAKIAVQKHFIEMGIFGERLEPFAMAQCQWLLDLDGNVNSWGLLWKLLSGSCVIRVRSTRGQWFHHRLQHQKHLVEIENDLSDLEAKLNWCVNNPDHCEAIAAAGQQIAYQVLDDLGADILSAIRSVAAINTPQLNNAESTAPGRPPETSF